MWINAQPEVEIVAYGDLEFELDLNTFDPVLGVAVEVRGIMIVILQRGEVFFDADYFLDEIHIYSRRQIENALQVEEVFRNIDYSPIFELIERLKMLVLNSVSLVYLEELTRQRDLELESNDENLTKLKREILQPLKVLKILLDSECPLYLWKSIRDLVEIFIVLGDVVFDVLGEWIKNYPLDSENVNFVLDALNEIIDYCAGELEDRRN